MTKAILSMLGGLLLASSNTSFAQDARDDPSMCTFLEAWGEVEGRAPTAMAVMQGQRQFEEHDVVLLTFLNTDWSISKGEELGTIKLTDATNHWFSYEAESTDNGFFLWARYEDAAKIFGRGTAGFNITRDGKHVAALSLKGVYTRWREFADCRHKKVKVKEEAERKQRLEQSNPKDPFGN